MNQNQIRRMEYAANTALLSKAEIERLHAHVPSIPPELVLSWTDALENLPPEQRDRTFYRWVMNYPAPPQWIRQLQKLSRPCY